MKRFYNIMILALIGFMGMVACDDNPDFPDPGFDLLTDREITVWRDTTDRAFLQLNVVAPGGVDFIEILDGRTYETVEELRQYRGQKNFTFRYELDLRGLDKTQDETLMYNVRVVTLDNRGYNTAFKLHIRKLSNPEVSLPNNTIGVENSLIGLRGSITTGYYKLRSIKVFIEGKEEYSVPEEEIKGISDYNLRVNLPYPVALAREYEMRIEVIDERGEVHNEYVILKGIRASKVERIEFVNGNKRHSGTFWMTYEENDRISTILYESDVPSNHWTLELYYNDDGMAEEVVYYYLDNPYRPEKYKVEFTYGSDGLLTGVVHNRYSKNWDFYNTEETIRNIRYREDGTYLSFDANMTTIENVAYADGFFPGEKIFADSWRRKLSSTYINHRAMKADFVPTANPVYLDGMPQLWYPSDRDISEYLLDLFFYKYLYLDEIPVPGNTSEIDSMAEYDFSLDDNGRLESFIEDQYAKLEVGWYVNTFNYFYEEQE